MASGGHVSECKLRVAFPSSLPSHFALHCSNLPFSRAAEWTLPFKESKYGGDTSRPFGFQPRTLFDAIKWFWPFKHFCMFLTKSRRFSYEYITVHLGGWNESWRVRSIWLTDWQAGVHVTRASVKLFELGVRTPGGLCLGVWYAGGIDFRRTPSVPIFGIISDLLETTKPTKLCYHIMWWIKLKI